MTGTTEYIEREKIRESYEKLTRSYVKKVLYIPISTFKKLKEDEKKSFNIKMVGDAEYFSLEIPGVVKRTFIDSDYTVLSILEDGQ